jgi:hypothetical protein
MLVLQQNVVRMLNIAISRYPSPERKSQDIPVANGEAKEMRQYTIGDYEMKSKHILEINFLQKRFL